MTSPAGPGPVTGSVGDTFVGLVLTDRTPAMRAEVEGVDLHELRVALLRIAASPPGCTSLRDPDGVPYRGRAFLRIQHHLATARSAHPADLASGPRSSSHPPAEVETTDVSD